jgi:adenylate cyclase
LYSPQTRKRLRRGLTILTATLIVLFCFFERKGLLDWLENRSSDWRVQATLDPAKADHDIVLVDIDNTSYRVLSGELGRWPWTRRIWTELLGYVSRGKPRMVILDILFGGPESTPGVDQGFASAIANAGNVVLPFAFASISGEVGTEAREFPPEQAAVSVAGPVPGVELKRSEWSLNRPHSLFAQAMAASGINLGNADPDGITRRLPLIERYGGRNWAAVWLAATMRLTGAKTAEFRTGEFLAGPIRLPVDGNGAYILRWHGDPIKAYRRIPLAEMVCSMQPEICPPDATHHPVSEFQNKIVFVGASAGGSFEVRPTPVSETAPGVFLLETALDNLLHNDAIRRPPGILTILLIVLLASLPAWAVAGSRSIAVPLAVTFGALAIYGGACFLFYAHSIWLPMSAPMLAGAVSFAGNTAFRYLTVDRELSRTRGTLERYVSPQLVKYVMDNIDSIRFDGQKRKLTVFFSDVRSFTTLTEKSDPVRLLRQLNEYLEAMTDIIFKYDGIVDKFIGDGIMAHWGAFTPDRPNAALAARAALEMMEKLAELNEHWKVNGFPPLDIGIGLNTAEVIFGNVGAGKKLDFTAIGDGVNLAARLESSNKEYKTHIIISESTREELGEAAEVVPLGTVVVKGKTVGVTIFELKSLTAPGVAAAP